MQNVKDLSINLEKNFAKYEPKFHCFKQNYTNVNSFNTTVELKFDIDQLLKNSDKIVHDEYDLYLQYNVFIQRNINMITDHREAVQKWIVQHGNSSRIDQLAQSFNKTLDDVERVMDCSEKNIITVFDK